MTDPMNSLVSFQQEIQNLDTLKCKFAPNYVVFHDTPNGRTRLSYAKVVNGTAQAISIFAEVQPIEGTPCFNIGYAVDMKCRGQGLSVEAVNLGIAEMKNGFGRNGHPSFYIEAVVGKENEPSLKVAESIFSSKGEPITDVVSGMPALYFKRLIKLP